MYVCVSTHVIMYVLVHSCLYAYCWILSSKILQTKSTYTSANKHSQTPRIKLHVYVHPLVGVCRKITQKEEGGKDGEKEQDTNLPPG